MSLIIGSLAIINTVGYLAVIWAFRASFRDMESATWWFAMGFAILAGAIIARGLYWDVSLPLMRLWFPEFAEAWSEATRGRLINIVFSSMKMLAFFSLRRRLLASSSNSLQLSLRRLLRVNRLSSRLLLLPLWIPLLEPRRPTTSY